MERKVRQLLIAAFFVFFVGNLYALEDKAVTTLNISFADIERSKDILSSKDKFIATLTPFDKSARMKTYDEVSEEAFLQFLSNNVLSWTADEKKRIQPVINSIKRKISQFNLTFPEEVLLIKTTGLEELGGAYTRENAVIISEKIAGSSEDELEKLLTDSILHIFLRYNPDIRNALCEVIGFSCCNEIEIPGVLVNNKITDPDALRNDHTITVSYKDAAVHVVPIIVRSKTWTCGMNQGKPAMCFNLEPKFMVIEEEKETWKAKLTDSGPVLLGFSEVSRFYEKVGRNARNTWHPEEIVVDNLIMLINDDQAISTPEIVDEMKKCLTK